MAMPPANPTPNLNRIFTIVPLRTKEEVQAGMVTEDERKELENATEEERLVILKKVVERLDIQRRERINKLREEIEEEETTGKVEAIQPPQLITQSQSLPPPRCGLPRFWVLFPILLPRSVREKVYEPCAEELKEDYLRERKRWKGRFSRRWITFCFTVRTAVLVAQSLWVATGGSLRKGLFVALALVFGKEAVSALREWLAAWFGRLL